MRRREFITLIGGAAATRPFAALAQQAAMPVIGYLSSNSPDEGEPRAAAFRRGLQEAGYVVGQNVAIEYRWAEHQIDRLPAQKPQPLGHRFLDEKIGACCVATRPGETGAAYSQRGQVAVGGLMSYGTDLGDAFRQVGVYTGSVLKGAKPADLPVLQSTKFEFVLNLQTVRLLGIEVPPGIISIADEVIE